MLEDRWPKKSFDWVSAGKKNVEDLDVHEMRGLEKLRKEEVLIKISRFPLNIL